MNVDLAELDYLKKQHVHVAILAHDNSIAQTTIDNWRQWENLAKQSHIRTTFTTFDAGRYDFRGRNALVAEFLGMTPATHLLLVNGDIKFEPFHVLALLSSKKHVISGYNQHIVQQPGLAQEGPYREIIRSSAEFMMLSREACIYLQKEHKDIIPIENDYGVNKSCQSFLRMYFDTNVRDGKWLRDDWEFCERWRDIGGHVWMHSQVVPVRVTKSS